MHTQRSYALDKVDFEIDFDSNMEFDIEGFNDTDIISNNRYSLPKLYKKIKTTAVKYDNAVEFAKETQKQILNGEMVCALLSGNFIFGDFIESFAVESNILIDNLTLSTLSLSRENIDSLHNLVSGGYLSELNIIVSDYFWSHNRQNAPYIYDNLDIDNCFQLAVSGTHTKITLIKTGGKKIIITGSANFRSSRSIEEITIQTNSELYDFHMEWHQHILERYGTIKKPLRASKLYDSILKNTPQGGRVWGQE